jgi:hypothetical protein
VLHLGSENNMRSHNRRTRPGVPAQWDDRRRHSDSDRIAFSDPDSNGYGKWYPVAYGNAKWHDKSHGNTKSDSKRYGKS